MNVTAILFEGFETLDMFGPVEMLGASGEFDTKLYSQNGGVVTSYQGVPVLTERLDAVDAPEVLLLPGGMGVYTMLEDDAFIARIAELAKKARYVLSVCNGAFIYAKAGVLDGKRATTFKGRIDKAEADYPDVNGSGAPAGRSTATCTSPPASRRERIWPSVSSPMFAVTSWQRRPRGMRSTSGTRIRGTTRSRASWDRSRMRCVAMADGQAGPDEREASWTSAI